MSPAQYLVIPAKSGISNCSHPHLTLIENPDLPRRTLYRLARILYAETRAASLAEVESLASLVSNLKKSGRSLSDISEDRLMFECLDRNSARHQDLLIRHDSPALQMCLRTLSRSLSGILPDCIKGATNFHRAEFLPLWSTDIGSIIEIGNLHFYK
jgi:hypothetical protein